MAPATGYRFRPASRLRRTVEFGAVFSRRRVLRGDWFHLHYTSGGQTARLGLVVAKKLARRAVWRNAVKRIGREAFRHCLPGLPPLDLILRLAKRVDGVDATKRRAWRAEIDGLLAKLPK
ncbi:hypothetical protein RHDC4_00728 [Rhodocyclaceae bacterium]|nr:hypothetical protein RHDC4_00728 [Rhodocyclaceae bacterium]